MVGPDADGQGGISRVIKTYLEEKFFEKLNIKIVSTVPNLGVSKQYFLIKSLIKFMFLSIGKCRGVYIHTASRNSFYRKSFFIIISSILRKKIALHIHPSFFFNFISNFYGYKKKIIYYILEKIDVFIVLTIDMKKKMNYAFPEKTIYVLENPINVDYMDNTKLYKREKNSILYLGNYYREKGIYDLISAMAIVKNNNHKIKLKLYGNKNKMKLKKYVKKKNLENYISVNEWINSEKKKEALYKCSILVLPSYNEGIPNVILEAMATKTPIIATAVGGLKELLIDETNAIITKCGDPETLARKIIYLINDDNLKYKIAENAYELIKKRFDGKIIKEKFLYIIKKEFY
jgi:glycosyltransferase involved in cell wall biosynthesis